MSNKNITITTRSAARLRGLEAHTSAIVVQLHRIAGCEETTFTPAQATRNDGRTFKAKF